MTQSKPVQVEEPIADEELDALMAELEIHAAGVVVPVVAATPAAEPEPEPAPPTLKEVVVMAKTMLEKAKAAFPEAAAEVAATLTPEKVDAAMRQVLATAHAPAPAANPTTAGKRPQLRFYLDVEQFKKDIAVSEHNLDNAMMEQAGLFAYHAAESARAEAQYARLKTRLGQIEAKAQGRARASLAAAGEKVTEKMVEMEVRLDPEYMQAQNLVIEAEMVAGFNKGAVEAMKQRKDMIVQIGADRREESKGQVRTVMNEVGHADMKARAIAALGR